MAQKKTKRKTKAKKAKTRKKATRKKAAAKKPGKAANPAFDFIVAQHRKNKSVDFATIRDRGAKKGLTIYPVMFGRAKLLLGMVKPKKKKAGKRGPGRPPKVGRRGPGRPRKAGRRAAAGPLDAVRDLVASLGEQEKANERLRATLEKVKDLIDRAL